MDVPRIGISRCLLGDAVRYDGGHKRDSWLIQAFGTHVEWVPVCPEVEAGMGTPREPIHLVASPDGVRAGEAVVRLLGVTSGEDWTDRMARWAQARTRGLASLGLSGFILKRGSPSCGLEHVPVSHVRDAGDPLVSANGRGLFAERLIASMPDLPVEDERRLADTATRANFIERIFAYARLKELFGTRWTVAGLVRFHTAHKLQLLAHSRRGYTQLGHLVARATEIGRAELASGYQRLFMDTLRKPTTPGRHADVLMHMLGHLKRALPAPARRDLLAAIDAYRGGLVPLLVPITLLKHHAREADVAYLRGQLYLDPHPRELCLRFHA